MTDLHKEIVALRKHFQEQSELSSRLKALEDAKNRIVGAGVAFLILGVTGAVLLKSLKQTAEEAATAANNAIGTANAAIGSANGVTTQIETAITVAEDRIRKLEHESLVRINLQSDELQAEVQPVGSVTAFVGPLVEGDLAANDSHGREDAKKQRDLLAKAGWHLCDGVQLPRDGHRALFDAIRDTYALDGDADDQVRLPDFRGYFLRGVASGKARSTTQATLFAAANDRRSSEGVGSLQDPATGLPHNESNASHQAAVGRAISTGTSTGASGDHHPYPYITKAIVSSFTVKSSTGKSSTGKPDRLQWDSETRPFNVCVHWIIRVK